MGEPLEGLRIVLQAQSGDRGSQERCFRRIWETYYPRLMVFARGCGGAAGADAEDLVQEIMEKVYRGIRTYNPTWSFSTWVYTIARNACRDRARRAHAVPSALSLADLPGPRQPADPWTPEQELLRRDTDRRVKEFFGAADPETRQLAFLRFHERAGYRQIASIMGVPLGTVKFRLHDLRRKLRSHLEEEDGEHRALRAQAF